MKTKTWLDNEIPQGWKLTRLKNVIISVKNGIWGDEPLNNSDDIECVRIADFDRKKNIVKDKEFTVRNIPKIQSVNYLLKKGDLLIEKSGGGEKQPVGFVVQYNLDKKAVYANFMAKIELNNQKVDSTFMNYVFSSLYAVKANLKAFNQTTGIQNLNISVYLNEVFMYPSLEIQKSIVSFLEKKIQAIDQTINSTQTLVELLRKQRQSIITEAVTKGLNPNIKLIDSGVKWVGEVPEHWSLKKIKYTSYVKGRIGWQGLKAEEFKDEGPYLVTGTDFKDGKVDWERCYRISEERYNQAPEIQLSVGDLLITKDGTIGKLALIHDLPGPASLNSHLLVIRPLKREFTNEYLYWYFKSKVFLEYVEHTKTGTTFYGISQDSIENFTFACPDIVEQNEISTFINNKIYHIDKLIKKNKNMIDNLKEYRQALIYEAVTGKIDVLDMELEKVR